MLASSLTTRYLSESLPVAWKPHQGQKLGIKFMVERACAGLFAEPGVGKTSITLAVFKLLKRKGLVTKMLIVAPLRPCYLVWPAECEKWKDFAGLRCVVLHGPNKEKALKADADIFIINPEGLPWLLESPGAGRVSGPLKRLRSLGCDMLVVDELSKFKNSQSQRFKLLKHCLRLFHRRYGLTGSPAANGLEGLFGQVYVLDQGATFGQYISHFRGRYFIPSYSGFGWDLRKGAEEQIYEALKPLVLRLDAKDFVELPELVLLPPSLVQLPSEAQKTYVSLEDTLVAELTAQDRVVAVNAAVALMKCRQVASGAVYVEGQDPEAKRTFFEVHQEKIKALEDLIDELQGKPLMVAYEFQHEAERLRKAFPDAEWVRPGMAGDALTDLQARWNAGSIAVLLVNPQTVGHGLNLQGAGNHVCWFTLTWDFELYDQLNRRIYRQGNKNTHVFVHHLVAKDTVDEVVWRALQGKSKTQADLMTALKKQFTQKR